MACSLPIKIFGQSIFLRVYQHPFFLMSGSSELYLWQDFLPLFQHYHTIYFYGSKFCFYRILLFMGTSILFAYFTLDLVLLSSFSCVLFSVVAQTSNPYEQTGLAIGLWSRVL
jgi:hypothetical protein